MSTEVDDDRIRTADTSVNGRSIAIRRATVSPAARRRLRHLTVAPVTHAQVRDGQDDPALLEIVRALDRRELSTKERIQLVRLLVRPQISRPSAHPIPELADRVTPEPDGADGLDPILALHAAGGQAATEDVVRLQLMRLIPELTQLLRKTAFVLDHVLVVPRGADPKLGRGARSVWFSRPTAR